MKYKREKIEMKNIEKQLELKLANKKINENLEKLKNQIYQTNKNQKFKKTEKKKLFSNKKNGSKYKRIKTEPFEIDFENKFLIKEKILKQKLKKNQKNFIEENTKLETEKINKGFYF